ncbi:hypothetical protein [Mycolicibacterium gilvum]|uniref:Mce associated membrane protein n=1 Tax=Mycolicibacterium gilvum (strain DSM 45189 / LMG 24558 / Spyr1) TaxID=278137 RepID=E6TLX6_MYCSR|nr:hypothetical protein [Mycolicibacterium gilvum]ADT98204.1 hypothetical protein Mspyr1_15340 [Mycolicibacterium gilvum Spyr1]
MTDDVKGDGESVDLEKKAVTEAEPTEAATEAEPTEAVTEAEPTEAATEAEPTPSRGIQWSRVVAFIVLPVIALVLAAGAGYLKWLDNSNRDGSMSVGGAGRPSLAETSVQAARDGTIALLSYAPDTVEQQLGAARELLTGEFRDSYTSLTNDVVIPGAKEKQISAIATVPAAASVSVTGEEAVVLLFVNQTVTMGPDAPTDTASSVRVTLEKDGDRWLISKFDPV